MPWINNSIWVIKFCPHTFPLVLVYLQLQRFASQNEVILSGASREIRQVLEHVTANVAWMEGSYDSVIAWLEGSS